LHQFNSAHFQRARLEFKIPLLFTFLLKKGVVLSSVFGGALKLGEEGHCVAEEQQFHGTVLGSWEEKWMLASHCLTASCAGPVFPGARSRLCKVGAACTWHKNPFLQLRLQ
jgi:hypothetical protein